jgi:Family of unknown function (DUF6307)
MTSESTLISPYEKRVLLIQETLKSHSKIGDAAAGELAVHVLDALNSIPEQIR